jgi:hypothetical protein
MKTNLEGIHVASLHPSITSTKQDRLQSLTKPSYGLQQTLPCLPFDNRTLKDLATGSCI